MKNSPPAAPRGIAVEVVPGITTAQGAASRLLVSLTRRGEARRVQYITGHATIDGRDAKLPGDIDWSSVADPAVTTVVYMPIRTLPELVATAVKAGLDPATPAVAVERATRADERVIAGTISDLPAKLAAEPPSGPVIVMIGRVFAQFVAEALREAQSVGPGGAASAPELSKNTELSQGGLRTSAFAAYLGRR